MDLRAELEKGSAENLPSTGGVFKNPSVSRGIATLRVCPKVSLFESLANKAVAIIMRRQRGHPVTTGSSFW